VGGGTLEPRARHVTGGGHTVIGCIRFLGERHGQSYLRYRHRRDRQAPSAWRLAAAMRAVGCFPPDVVQPIAVAEESGSLDAMLLDLATPGDRQVDEQTSAFASLCEPVVIVVFGALVGGLVVAMYLPIVQLGNVV
jgi:type II secretory pathway component PulF